MSRPATKKIPNPEITIYADEDCTSRFDPGLILLGEPNSQGEIPESVIYLKNTGNVDLSEVRLEPPRGVNIQVAKGDEAFWPQGSKLVLGPLTRGAMIGVRIKGKVPGSSAEDVLGNLHIRMAF